MSFRMISLASRASRSPARLLVVGAGNTGCLRPPVSRAARPNAGHCGGWVGAGVDCRRHFAARAKGKGAASAKAAATRALGEGAEGVSKKQLALTMALKQVEMAYGKGAVMQLGSRQVAKVEVTPTGSLSLDHVLGVGGLPKGRVVEVYGPESSGKTTVALHAVAECQKAGGTAVFIDAEHALDATYARAIGVDMANLYLAQPDNGEQALDIVDTLVKSAAVDMVVVDSVAALVPKAELEGEMGDHHIALQARLMSQALRKLTAILNNTSCTLIFINQIRQKVGVIFGSPDVTTGGMALRFYSSVRLEVRKGQAIKSNGEMVGTKVKVKVAKNKLAPPFGKTEVDLIYGKGFDLHGELLDLGCEVGLLSRSGAWFGVNSAFAVEGTELVGQATPWLMGQGREKSKVFLSTNPRLAQKIQKAIVAKLAAGETHIGAETEAIPSDPAFPITSSDNVDAEDTPLVPEVALGAGPEPEPENSGGEGLSASGGDASSSSSSPPPRGGGGEEGEGVLLEPGVASVADLFETEVFTKEPVKKDGKGSGVAGDGAEGKEELRA